ncbi:NACHT domain-containing protein [Roseateles sp. LYH14W]|uniref:NACHT domain-containing protein n=1 Tax=Pelomonas parva TaxID=3299032 RepID=A0ABW7EZJ2_9BURK
MPSPPAANLTVSLTGPADSIPAALPVMTREQVLPFGQLTWENFERLCHRLISLDAEVEHAARYGRSGDAQQGLDVYARQANGRYHCLQAKRHKSFSAGQIGDAVDLFMLGSWASRSERFTIAVQASLRATDVQDEIERQAAKLAQQGIVFVALDGEELTSCLRDHPLLIDDFFGRPWVAAVLGAEAAEALKTRLDGGAFARARSQLAAVYETHFHFVDPGSFGSVVDTDGRPALTLLERYLAPDVLVHEKSSLTAAANDQRNAARDAAGSEASQEHSREGWARTIPKESSRTRRIPLIQWAANSQRLVVLGDAGSGKSTLLRVIALDILHSQSLFPEFASQWGRHLPVYIPFARWSAQAAREGGIVGVKEIVRRTIEQLLTESLANLINQAIDDHRVLLLIDGLDEWSSEQAARTTLSALVTSVEAHGIPAIVSGRPRGLDRIGALPATWKRAKIAPLSEFQQGAIASRWFARFSSSTTGEIAPSDSSLRTSRFMAELSRDASLGELASTPLLLVGLVTLALRGQILPRTRGEVYNQLVRVLLEVHPNNRATASGDTESRFRHASEDQRRAAIARLAYEVWRHAGGAGIALSDARDTLHSYLASPKGFELDYTTATNAASEILSVNSETQGLIVEKSPGEVGFVHASFEEYLAAEHIGGWPFAEIEEFVRSHAGQSRWRNVVANLLSYVQRRDEFDRLVAIIEEPASDEPSWLNKQALLGDVAFGVAARAVSTAKRLSTVVMQSVEALDWMPARREALASVLKGLNDPALRIAVERRLSRWLPNRLSWRQSLVDALGHWEATPELRDTLFRALHDEDRGVQRAAANAYARAFSESESALQHLIQSLAVSRDHRSSVAMLEAVALGWPSTQQSIDLFQLAWDTREHELRLVGAMGLSAQGMSTPAMRDAAMRAQSNWSAVSYEYRSIAIWMLRRYWPNDPELIKSAVDRMTGRYDSVWEYDAAASYLMACDIANVDLRKWVLAEFTRQHPFNFHFSEDTAWQKIGQFAASDEDIRKAANAYWQNPENRIIGMRHLVGYVTHVCDSEIAAVLREVLQEEEHGFNRFWALHAMLTGWGREHPEVRQSIDMLMDESDEQLLELASLMPAIYRDKKLARERLLSMADHPKIRFDLLTDGFSECGCTGADDQVVQKLLKAPLRKGLFSPTSAIIELFSQHPDVRSLAERGMQGDDPPLASIASAYRDDPDLAEALFAAAVPLPLGLRTQVIEYSAGGAPGTTLDAALGMALQECDSELRVRMSILRYRAIAKDHREAAIQELLQKSVAVGPDFEAVRGAALAGLIAIGAVDELVNMQDREKPIGLYTGNVLHQMPSLYRLICEQYGEIESKFGDSLTDRLERSGQGTKLGSILSTAPSASPAAKAAFLKLADAGKLPLDAQALHSLAAERPRSQTLLNYCWQVLESRDENNSTATLNAEVAEILRSQFPDENGIHRRLVALHSNGHDAASSIALVIYSPLAEELGELATNVRHRNFADWAVAVRLSAARDNSESFVKLLERMATREHPTQFDAQDCINRAVYERLQHDSELVELLAARLRKDVNGSISGTFARYLTSAAKLDAASRARALDLLQSLAAEQRLVVVSFDAVAGRYRALRATLLDAVAAGVDLT